MLGVAGRGLGRFFGFIRALEDESVREAVEDRVAADEESRSATSDDAGKGGE